MEDTGENETERKTNEHDYNEIAGGSVKKTESLPVWMYMPESLNFWMKRPRPLFTARMAKRSKRDSFWEK